MKKKAFVLGSNVEESLSPHIFQYWFKQNNINAEYFVKKLDPNISTKDFEDNINKIFKEKNICGFNVTIPFKEIIKKKLNQLDEHSQNIGAVNCVSKINNVWVGKNTDWIGFLKALNASKINIKKERALVIGYGGASKAAIYALQLSGFNEINVYNRTYSKIEKLQFINGINIVKFDDLPNLITKQNIIINTTPNNILSSQNSSSEKIDIPAFDIVYKPKNTDFLRNFLENKRIFGIAMLVYQAAPCFEDWFGVQPIIDRGLFESLEQYIKND